MLRKEAAKKIRTELKEQGIVNMSYQAEYEDNGMEVFSYPENDEEALEEAYSHEDEHGILFNLFLLNENDDIIKTII